MNEKQQYTGKRDDEMVTVRTKQRIIDNLRDAGCDEKTIQDFILAEQQGGEKKEQRILEQHRKSLLHTLNAAKKQIDCLDYLVYQMGK